MKIHKKELFAFIKKIGVVTSSEVASHFKLSWNTAESYLMELLVDQSVKRIKKGGVTLWLIKK